MDLESLNRLFAQYEVDSFTVGYEKAMGFSGAKIQKIIIDKWRKKEKVSCDGHNDGSPPPNQLFVKHIVFTKLPADAQVVSVQKDNRNRCSYVNEINFINGHIPSLRETNMFFFPNTYKSSHHKNTDACEQVEAFTFYSDCLSDVGTQFCVFDSYQFRKVLQWTATLHAFYFGKVDQANEVYESQCSHVEPLQRHQNGLWAQGTHLALEKRPSAEVDKLGDNWNDLCISFGWNELKGLGNRLHQATAYIAKQLSVANRRNIGRTTIVHGDVKPGNVFFLAPDFKHSSDSDVCLIDYQWTGVALGVTDIIYLIATSSADSFVEKVDLEEDVLRPYYCTLSSHFEKFQSKPLPYKFDELCLDFRLSVLDYARWAVSCRLGGESPEKYESRREHIDPNLGTYRFSEVVLHFILELVGKFLPEIEQKMNNSQKTDK